jgi:hypothetical protein
VAAPTGHYHIRVTFDGEDRKPPADVLEEIAAMLRSWQWK